MFRRRAFSVRTIARVKSPFLWAWIWGRRIFKGHDVPDSALPHKTSYTMRGLEMYAPIAMRKRVSAAHDFTSFPTGDVYPDSPKSPLMSCVCASENTSAATRTGSAKLVQTPHSSSRTVTITCSPSHSMHKYPGYVPVGLVYADNVAFPTGMFLQKSAGFFRFIKRLTYRLTFLACPSVNQNTNCFCPASLRLLRSAALRSAGVLTGQGSQP